MLGGQWRLGELLGEDAGSAIAVTLDGEVAMVSRCRGAGTKAFQAFDLDDAALEVIVEAEPQRTAATWTARLRIDTGRAFERALELTGLEAYAAAYRAAFSIEPPAEALRASDPAGARLISVARSYPRRATTVQSLAAPLRAGGALPDTPGVAAADALAETAASA